MGRKYKAALEAKEAAKDIAFKKRQICKAFIDSIKAQGCQLCGYNQCLAAIDLHHVSTGKEFAMADYGSHPLKAIQREITKCVVVCANCHRKIHEHDIKPGTLAVVKKKDDNQHTLAFGEAV